VIYLETLSNPMLRVADVKAISAAAHRANAVCVVDDTFTTPVNLKPLALGADVVVASATKYLNGHSDVVAGVVCGAARLISKVRDLVAVTGGSADPFAAYLLLRGLKTLPLRVARQNATALRLATDLSAHADVEMVAYPFVTGHPDHELARSMLAGGGGIVTVRVRGGDERAHELQRHLRLIQPATSLGGVESVVCIPAETSHESLSDEERFALGILPGSLRFSFGIEDPEDLWSDLSRSLELSTAVAGTPGGARQTSSRR
jgi:cystathionine beta-lyase/cystathionine gamma-synthase